jgi:adenylate cyclase
MKNIFLKKISSGVLTGIVSAIIVWIVTSFLFWQFFFRMEAQTYDWRLKRAVEQPKNPIEDIVIIDVDERTIQKLGSFIHWPREYWVKLINYLQKADVALIGLDFIFDPDPRNPEGDLALQNAISKVGNVCNAFYFSQADQEHFRPAMANEPENLNYQRFTWNLPENLFPRIISQERFEPAYPGFLNASMTAGYVNLFPDPDGVVRRIPFFLRFNQNIYPSFAIQMALQLKKIQQVDFDSKQSEILLTDNQQNVYSVPIDPFGQMLISYFGGFKSFRYISFYDVLMGFVQSEYFKGKVILVGSSLPGLYDLRTTPLQPAFPGVEINANILYQLIQNRFIHQISNLYSFLLMIIVGLIAGILLSFPRPLGSIIVTVLLIFLIILMGVLVLEHISLWLPIVPPLFVVIVAFALTYVYRYLFEEKDKRQIRKIFSHYVSHSVVEVLLKDPEKVKLGGEKKFCTVLFSDISGFTTMAEKMEPAKLVQLLNDYLTAMTNIILENKGMLDKYEGDAIMAVFGAPAELKDHAELACHSALQMQKQLGLLNNYWQKIDRPLLSVRIGINSGEMIVGNMGSETRFDYTVVGDAVNLSSRLETANRVYNTGIIIGEQTYDIIHENFVTRPLDLLRVKGKNKPVRVYELIAHKNDELDIHLKNLLISYKKGFKEYLLRNWQESIKHFQDAMQLKGDDGPSKLLLDRCREFSANPPADNWDGVYVMQSK